MMVFKTKRKRGKFYKGFYRVKNVEKYLGDLSKVEYRSSWELFFMRWLDNNPNVVKWNSEGIVIKYFSKMDGKTRRYFVDFYVKFKDGKEFIYEIKPHKQVYPPKIPKKLTDKAVKRFHKEKYDYNVNLDKWVSAYDSARKSGMEFKVITEKTLEKIGLRL